MELSRFSEYNFGASGFTSCTEIIGVAQGGQIAEPILVTGAAGFIGFHVARRLAASGRTVIGIDNLNAYSPRSNRRGSRSSPASMRSASANST